jgi:alanine racemase
MIQKSNSTVTVNLAQLKKNLETLSGHVNEETRMMAVVKADAYGHGAVQVAQTLEPLVSGFAVNDIHEGIELREEGITKPILVFEVPQKAFASQYRIHNLTATVSAQAHIDLLPKGTSYHINFDTGMGRLGFPPEEAKRAAKLVEDNKELFCTGIYTHFATADNPGSELVMQQHDRFKTIRQYFPDDLTAHISNTGGTTFYDTRQFNMVRLGIGLYGYPPGQTNIEGLEPIMQWKTRLAHVKRIAARSTVSYGARWQAPRDGYLGVIPVGYDDGVKRNLSGQLSVQIKGKRYDIVGTITMNYCMVYLGADNFEPGTEVEVLNSENNAQDWAENIGTIPYEILTSVNPKIPRKYIQ